MKYIPLILAGLMVLPLSTTAQENIAGGTLQQEASWSALRTLVGKADGKADVAQITANSALDKANKIETCGKLGMIYAPGVAGADPVTGCKSVAFTPSGMSVKTHTETLCVQDFSKPYSVVASCKADEELLSCAGGPGDQDEEKESWILLADYKKKTCTGRADKSWCHTEYKTSNPDRYYYSQIIVQANCYKP